MIWGQDDEALWMAGGRGNPINRLYRICVAAIPATPTDVLETRADCADNRIADQWCIIPRTA